VTHPHISTNETGSSASQIPIFVVWITQKYPKHIYYWSIPFSRQLNPGATHLSLCLQVLPAEIRAAVGTARNKQLHLAMLTWKSRNHHYQIGFRVDLALILFSTMLCYFGSYSSIWELLIWDIFRAFVFAHGYRYWYLFGTVLSRVRSADHFESKTGWWCNFTIWKNDGVRQWGWDDIPYMMEKNPNVWNQQSEKISN
jgi:hypothetical protein